MKKSERLHDMLQFLKDKQDFNLKDLMEHYDISKSTAIRDVQSLELLGLPIYTEQGRNGKYVILQHRILAPMMFTVDEMHALYFAMLTLEGYKSKPFQYEIHTLEEKFKAALPQHVNANIQKMKRFIQLEITNQSNFNPYLKEVIQGIIEEKMYVILYDKQKKSIQIKGQFIQMKAKFGQWYSDIYNMDSHQIQHLRCDKIIALEEVNDQSAMDMEYLLSLLPNHHKQHHATSYTVVVTEKGKDLFDKEHYPSMSIQQTEELYTISGYYNADEQNFIAEYFLRYGKSIQSIYPSALKDIILHKLDDFIRHFRENV
ncbi:helix-turn-helix transcriptional regulator [Longirhabdus pacifica]|uniref:helix-turn-helix transcriptional regulator n=1 Tax=Longirhabdus pacifica TaxID=2305227 RepID=UPI0010087413|nr:WYL domain-containing protein [Longirhabdus pacifica]